MGAESSYPESYEVIKKFIKLVNFVKEQKLSNNAINDSLKSFKKVTIEFFKIYEVVKKKKLNDISPYFEKIEKACESLYKCASYIDTKSHLEEAKAIKKAFQKDLVNFIKQLTNLSQISLEILQELIDKSSPTLMKRLYIDLSIFDFALNVTSTDKPPYYQMSTLPTYSLYDQMLKSKNKSINVVGPHGTGKTTLIPMFLACRSLSNEFKSKFIVLIENNSTQIHGIEECFKLIKKDKAIPVKYSSDEEHEDIFYAGSDGDADDDDDDDDSLIVTSSYQNVVELAKSKYMLAPVIAILSPLEALQLVHTSKDFAKKASFIIDDVHQRLIETDVLVQDVSRAVDKLEKSFKKAKIVLMSPVSDTRFVSYVGNCQDLEFTTKKDSTAEKQSIKCSSISNVGKVAMVREMRKLFDSWISKKKYSIGSVITFVPNAKTGRRIIKHIYKIYNKEDSMTVVPLRIQIRKGENLEDFNERLLNAIEIATVERAENPEAAAKAGDENDILFLLPIDMTGNVTEEMRSFIESKLPLPFLKKNFVRLIITTNKNEQYMRVPDLSVIFDSGLTETEYYDVEKGVSYYKEELLPKPFIEQRYNLLADSEAGVHFIFDVKNTARPSNLKPAVKRSNMIQAAFRLRGIGINLESQLNLPDEPNHEILDASINILKDLGIVDDESKELTAIGKQASRYSTVSPFFALATAKFTDKPEFAFLTSLIIERTIDLVEDAQSPLLCNHFNRESDVVTLLESILALNVDGGGKIIDENAVNFDESGLSIGALYSIYNDMSNLLKKEEKTLGRNAVVEAIQWAQKQPGGTLAMVDKFINLLDKNKFLDKRKGSFQHVVGAGPGLEPTLVYKSNPIFKFESEKDADSSIVKFSQRPGWNGLQAPGDIIILSFQMEESSQLNRGIILHRDPSKVGATQGVVSIEITNPSIKSYFFISLFEAYWNNQPTVNDFVGIYHSRKPEKQNAFLIHVTENNKKIYLNYCPRTQAVKDTMATAIPLLCKLMPFVPRSIVVKSEAPLCAVEVVAYGTSQQFAPNIFLIGDPTKQFPVAYSLNRQILEYAAARVDKLRATMPVIRFSITGEGVYYKFIHGRQIETDLDYPDVDPNIRSVFDPAHSSHLVLLIDSDYADKPGVPTIPWLPPAGAGAPGLVASNDEAEFKLMTDVASKILNGLGYAERSDDLFFVTLDGAYPIVAEGEIPVKLHNSVSYSAAEGGAIKGGVHQLVKQFTINFTKSQSLMEAIPLKLLGSTNKCTKYTNETAQNNIINQIKNTLKAQFGIRDDNDIDALFLGNSMIVIRIASLPPNNTSHPVSTDIWNDSYQKCPADTTIENALRGIGVPVTTITHEPTVSMCMQHVGRLGVNKKEFEDKVKKCGDDFGFLVYSVQEYRDGAHDADDERRGVIGEVFIDIIGTSSSIAFANRVLQEFPIRPGLENDMGMTMTMTMTMAAMTTFRVHADLDPRAAAAPKINTFREKAIRVPQSEIKAMQELVNLQARDKTKKRWKFDEKYRVLIIPIDDDSEAKKKLKEVRNNTSDVACLAICATEPQEFLPQSLYANYQDGSVKPFAVCKECAQLMLSEIEDIQFVLDPITHLIDQSKLKDIAQIPPGFSLVDHNSVGDEYWPQIPFGQLVWALMSDTTDILPLYVKTWFTIIVEFTIRSSKNYFTFCPNHNDVPLLIPKPGINMRCPHCNYFYCADCRNWHTLDDKCEILDPNIKRCPRCNVPSIKVSGCNRVTCSCGCSWCYKCTVVPPPGFNTPQECYAHLQAAHGGYWD